MRLTYAFIVGCAWLVLAVLMAAIGGGSWFTECLIALGFGLAMFAIDERDERRRAR